ncbi:hypothetical protein ACJQWK_08044 [Exserohilum turcicum]
MSDNENTDPSGSSVGRRLAQLPRRSLTNGAHNLSSLGGVTSVQGSGYLEQAVACPDNPGRIFDDNQVEYSTTNKGCIYLGSSCPLDIATRQLSTCLHQLGTV